MPYNWRGLVERRLGRQGDAERSFRAALDRDAESVRALVNLSSLLVDTRRAEEAIPLLRRAVALDPEASEARINLVVALGRGGNLEEARAEFEAAGGADDSPAFLNALAFACYLNHESDEARQLVERSLSIDPSQPDARRLLSRLDGGD
jgi:tetratricopeptide (TPR) repeat protein